MPTPVEFLRGWTGLCRTIQSRFTRRRQTVTVSLENPDWQREKIRRPNSSQLLGRVHDGQSLVDPSVSPNELFGRDRYNGVPL